MLEQKSPKSGVDVKKLGIVGGGPAALMICKRLIESGQPRVDVEIFEASATLGNGMPYSHRGANIEHVTNVSSDELPDLITPLVDWVKSQPGDTLSQFGLERDQVHEKEVIPRLLFGQYLTAQFEAILRQAAKQNLNFKTHCQEMVSDLNFSEDGRCVRVTTDSGAIVEFDSVVICTGHQWPQKLEIVVPGYFDSPYPPAKLRARFDNVVGIRGSSLTAIDAIRTLARANGRFHNEESGLKFLPNEDSQNFSVVMHSRHGLLPCIRVHMEEPHTAEETLISQSEIEQNIEANDGFLQLDFLFDRGFKQQLAGSDPSFFKQIKDMNLETFVQFMMSMREAIEPFELFKKEYEEAKKSIRQERPVYWKEMLSALSFAMNYPAKHLSAEDMIRLQQHLMPLISVVIAFVPQESCDELIALHEAGRLKLVTDGGNGSVELSEYGEIVYSNLDENGSERQTTYKTFVDCIGQPHLSIDSFPFPGLVKNGAVSHARLKFRDQDCGRTLQAEGELKVEKLDGNYYLRVSGAEITDSFQLVDSGGKASEQLYLMAVPYMGGFNPDYSGLDFCERASQLIVDNILKSSV